MPTPQATPPMEPLRHPTCDADHDIFLNLPPHPPASVEVGMLTVERDNPLDTSRSFVRLHDVNLLDAETLYERDDSMPGLVIRGRFQRATYHEGHSVQLKVSQCPEETGRRFGNGNVAVI